MKSLLNTNLMKKIMKILIMFTNGKLSKSNLDDDNVNIIINCLIFNFIIYIYFPLENVKLI